MATTLLLAEDHTLFRQALVALITLAPDLEVVAEAATGPETIEMALQHRPRVVVLDYSMPKLEGPEVATRILKQLPDTQIVALSMHGEARYVQNILDAGVHAYVLKTDVVTEIVEAIRAVSDGHRYLSMSVRQVVHFQSPQLDSAVLSRREEALLRLLAQDKSYAECSENLGLSVRTVETYQRRLLNKLNLGSTAEMVDYAESVGLVTLA